MFHHLIDKTTNLLHRALDLRSVKHQVTASNIANQDTPEYKAGDLDFKRAIRDFLPMPIEGPLSITNPAHMFHSIKLNQTDVNHIPINGIVREAEGYVVDSKDKTTRADKNNVNTEQEMARLAENNLMFNASTQMISGKFLKLKDAIREGR
jgi:flagellar basal-body rod protein FlgB